jgi:hypothetical protein
MTDTAFDFDGFKRAFAEQDIPAWAAYFADDSQWIEYKHTHPPRAPRVMSGRPEIEEFLARVKASNVQLEIGDEIVGPERAAFRVWCTLADGRRIIEHVIIHYAHGKITRQVDVEAWD